VGGHTHQLPPNGTWRVTPLPERSSEKWPVVDGFTILEELGRGGMGVVYKASQAGLNRIVALKIIRGGAFADDESRARFRSEAELIAKLHHPNIVQVYTIGTQHSPLGEALSCPFFAEEYVDGGNLADWLDGKPQPPKTAAQLVETLARAVHYAHQQGIVHRDLKPGNILLSGRGDLSGGREPLEYSPATVSGGLRPPLGDVAVKITDFGLAKQLESAAEPITTNGQVLGTPEYMAPEQATGTSNVGPPADIYALGAILYEMLTGRLPFSGGSPLETLEQVRLLDPVPPSRIQPRTPPDVQTICLKCLQKDPRKRYGSALQLAEDLERFRNGEPILARPVGAVERGWRWARRRPAIAGLLALVLFLLVGGLTVLTASWLHALAGWREADRQRLRAIDQRTQTEQQRQKAQEEQTRAERRQEEAESNLYFSQIAQARLQGRLGQHRAAGRLLDLSRPSDEKTLDRRGWEWHFLRGQQHSELLALDEPHSVCVKSVAFSPDGARLLTAGGSPYNEKDHTPDYVRIWHIFGPQNGICEREFPTEWFVDQAVWVQGQDAVAWASGELNVAAGDLATGRRRFTRQLGPGYHLATISPDGGYYAACDARGHVRAWRAEDGARVLMAKIGKHGPHQLAFNPNSTQLAIYTGTLRLWDIATNREIRTFPQAVDGLGRPRFSPDGKLLAHGTRNGIVRLFDCATGQLVHCLAGHEGGVQAIAFSADGEALATGGADQSVRIWRIRGGSEILRLHGHQGRVSSVSFHPSGRYLASGSEQPGEVKIWDLTRQQEYITAALTPDMKGYIEAVGFNATGSDVRIGLGGGWLQTARADTGALGEGFQVDLTSRWLVPTQRAAFSADGKLYAAAASERQQNVRVYQLDTGEPRWTFGHSQVVLHVCLSGNGKRLATAAVVEGHLPNGGRVVTVWDLENGARLAEFPCHPRVIPQPFGVLALSDDGQLLAYDDLELTPNGRLRVVLRIVDVASGEVLHELSDLPNKVCALAFSHNRRLLACTIERQGMRLYELEAARWQQDYAGQGSDEETKYDLAFSPDDKRLAGVSRSQVHLWDVRTGQAVLVLRGAPPRPGDGGYNPRIAWSRDGKRLAASNWNRTVSVWDAGERESAAAREAQHAAAEGRLPLR
jgi:WD40 repeat protein/predicted Ser/Thr protein kinase